MTVSGWLFDAYPRGDKMVFWIRDGDHAVRLEDSWTPSMYVASDSRADLEKLARNRAVQHYVRDYSIVRRYERMRDHEQKEVLKLTLADSEKHISLAQTIEDIDAHDRLRLYNVDVLPAQSYFYEHDLFPLAKCRVHPKGDGLEWELTDGVRMTDYRLPDFKVMSLDVKPLQRGRLPSFSDKIDTIAMKMDDESIELRGQSEQDVLQTLVDEIAKKEPDFIFTADGDEWVFPFLAERAASSGVVLTLSREKDAQISRTSKNGITYFSYGRVHYRASSVILYGRVHIDASNSLIHDPQSLHGLFELARVCRMPMHTVSRATIGRALTSMQFYLAHKRRLLVPWKPAPLEKPKTLRELVVADRGGLIIEPRVGVHEKVAEFDFVSLYPSIISKLNIGADTINCDCCPDSKNIVPELGYRVCEKRRGLVPESLEVPLQNRKEYKQFRKLATDYKTWAMFEARQGMLRVIGHVSFGYQGHTHSHLGLIDAHLAICAWARFIANRARRTAESAGYDVLHLIIDSLFTKRPGAGPAEYMRLKEEIERATGFEISYEGEYKWIAFLPSKGSQIVGVPNRYFGCYEGGKIKDRGIETRRHDTPPLFSRFQKEALQIMAQGNTLEEVKALMPKVRDMFQRYKHELKGGRVDLTDLIFTKMLSRDATAYGERNTVEVCSVRQLADEGNSLMAGEVLQYIITDYHRKNARKRSVPVELIQSGTTYDARRYVELLAEVSNTVTEPFGYKITP